MNFFPQKIKKTRSVLFIKIATIAFVLVTGCDKDEKIPEPYPMLGTCQAVNPVGKLNITNADNKYFVYETHGGGKMVYNLHGFIFTFGNYPYLKVELWGGFDAFSAIHENLNGKHIKDRWGNRRSFIFPDGAKITMVYAEDYEALLSVSIYEGNEIHHINVACNTVEYSSTNSPFVKQVDDAEPDGETATIESIEAGVLFLNIYTEDVAGQKVEERVLLGETYRDNINDVRDFYDDPRLDHT
jgi:hypothetical protein